MKLEQRLKVGTTRRDLAGLHDVLQKLVAGVRERLAGNYVGVYLQGSLATGDFDDSSDVDFLIITEDEPTEPVIAALQTFHQALYDDHPSHWAVDAATVGSCHSNLNNNEWTHPEFDVWWIP